MKYYILTLFLLCSVMASAQKRPDQQTAISPTDSLAFYTQETGFLRKVYLTDLKGFYAAKIDTLAAKGYDPAVGPIPAADHVKWIKGSGGSIWYIDGDGKALKMAAGSGGTYDDSALVDSLTAHRADITANASVISSLPTSEGVRAIVSDTATAVRAYSDANDDDTVYDDTALSGRVDVAEDSLTAIRTDVTANNEAIVVLPTTSDVAAAEQRAKDYADANDSDTVYDDTAIQSSVSTNTQAIADLPTDNEVRVIVGDTATVLRAYVDASAGPADNLGNHTATENLDFNGFKGIGLGTPTLATDAATKAYVDANAGGGGATYTPITDALLRSYADTTDRTEVYINNAFTVNDGITVPENVKVIFGPRGKISASSPFDTLRINGEIVADFHQIFVGDYRVILGKRYAKVDWFEPVMNDGVIDSIYKIITPSTNKIVHAMRKAKFAVRGGGTVEIGPGIYTGEDVDLARRQGMLTNGNYRENVAALHFYESIENDGVVRREFFDSLKFVGQGQGKTIVLAKNTIGDETGHAGVSTAIYRNGGWQRGFDQVSTYDPDVFIGQSHVDIRSGDDATIYKAGMAVGIVGGSSYSDQDFMQMNIVDSVSGTRLHLKYPWEKNFDLKSSSSLGYLLADFTVPAIDSSVIIKSTDFISIDEVSVGNDAYRIDNVDTIVLGLEYDITVTNLGKGNAVAGTVVPSGTGIYKNRVMMILTQTPRDLLVKDMTIVGRRDIYSNSNTINFTSESIDGVIATQKGGGGLVFNADGGYGFKSVNSRYRSAGPIAIVQYARSITKTLHQNDKFENILFEQTEFAANAKFLSCVIDITAPYKPTESVSRNTVFRIGTTSSGVVIDNCDFNVTGASSVFSSDEIGQYQATAGQGHRITNNTFRLDSVNRWWSAQANNALISGNQIYGSVETLISATSIEPNIGLDSTFVYGEGRTEGGLEYNVFTWGGPMNFVNNTFAGKIDNLVGNKLGNVTVKDFQIIRHGPTIAGDTVPETSSLVTPSYAGSTPFFVDAEFDVWGWLFNDVNDLNYDGGTLKTGNKIRVNSWSGRHTNGTVKDSVFCVGCPIEAKDIVVPDIVLRNYSDFDIPNTVGDTLPLTNWNAYAVTTGGGEFNLDESSDSIPMNRGDVVGLVGGLNTGGIVEVTAVNEDNNRWGVSFRTDTSQQGLLITVADYDANAPFLRLYRLTNTGGAALIGGTDVSITWPIGAKTKFKFTLSDSLRVFVDGVQAAAYDPAIASHPVTAGEIVLLDRFSSTSRLFTKFSGLFFNGDPAFEKQEIVGPEFASDQIKIESGKIDFTPFIKRGSGAPEGVVVAPPGTMYLNSLGGTGTTLYVKETGTGSTGWVAK